MGTEQMASDLEAAEVEVKEAMAAHDKTKGEIAALEETLRMQQASWRMIYNAIYTDPIDRLQGCRGEAEQGASDTGGI